MPHKAGDYQYRLEWLRRTAGAGDGFGQRSFSYPSEGYLWCAIDDANANRGTVKESERQITTATIRVRNYPDLAPGDRLRGTFQDFEYTWTVNTVVDGDNEVICDVDDVLKPT